MMNSKGKLKKFGEKCSEVPIIQHKSTHVGLKLDFCGEKPASNYLGYDKNPKFKIREIKNIKIKEWFSHKGCTV